MQHPDSREGATLKLFGKHSGPASNLTAPTVAAPTPLPTRHPLEGVGTIAADGEIELRNPLLLQVEAQRSAILAVILIPGVILFGIAIWIFLIVQDIEGTPPPHELFDLMTESLRKSLAKDWPRLAGSTMGALGTGLLLYLKTRERLYIGPAGLRYFSGMPRWMSSMAGDWSLATSAIRDLRVEYAGAEAPRTLRLVIEAGDEKRQLSIFDWADPARQTREDFKVLAGLRPDADAIAQLFETLPLVQYARERGFAIEMPESTTKHAFDIRERPRTTIAVGVAFAAFAYAAIDLGVVSETYAAGAPIWMLVLGGGSLGALTWSFVGDRETAQWVRGAVSLLVAAAAMAALYPGLIRVNRIGAPAPQPYAYVHTPNDQLEPASAESPQIDLPDIVSLLPGSEPGDIHELWIRHGSLGFDQVDIDRLDAWIEELAAKDGDA